jgi:hypothetical protein
MNALDLVQGNLVLPAVVELGGPGRGVPGDPGGDLQGAAVAQVIGNPRASERVVAQLRSQAGVSRPALDHMPRQVPRHRALRERVPSTAPAAGAEQGQVALLADAGGLDVFIEEGGRLVMDRHHVIDPAFFVQTEKGAPALVIVILDLHADGCGDAREGEDHQPDQGAVAQAHERAGVDRLEQRAHFVRDERRRLSRPDAVPRPLDGRRRVIRQDLADHQIVEQHADRRQVLLDGRRCRRVLLDIGRDHDRLDVVQLRDAGLGAPVEEPDHGPAVRGARVRVPDLG